MKTLLRAFDRGATAFVNELWPFPLPFTDYVANSLEDEIISKGVFAEDGATGTVRDGLVTDMPWFQISDDYTSVWTDGPFSEETRVLLQRMADFLRETKDASPVEPSAPDAPGVVGPEGCDLPVTPSGPPKPLTDYELSTAAAGLDQWLTGIGYESPEKYPQAWTRLIFRLREAAAVLTK